MVFNAVYFASGRWVKYCNQHICMFVCLFVPPISKTTDPNFANFSVHVTCRLPQSSVGNVRSYVLLVLWMKCHVFTQ